MSTKQIEVYSPASIANLGPGFDVFGMALDEIGDVLRLEAIPDIEIRVTVKGVEADSIPSDVRENSAGAVLQHVLDRNGLSHGFHAEIRKGVPPGKGLGSSGAPCDPVGLTSLEGPPEAGGASGSEPGGGGILGGSAPVPWAIAGGTAPAVQSIMRMQIVANQRKTRRNTIWASSLGRITCCAATASFWAAPVRYAAALRAPTGRFAMCSCVPRSGRGRPPGQPGSICSATSVG